MIIGIDASKAAVSRRTGVEEVAYRLCLELPKIDRDNTYRLYTRDKLPEEFTKSPNIGIKQIPFPFLWNRLRLPLELLIHKPDALLIPAYRLPSFSPSNAIVIIHDLAYKYFPEAYSKKELLRQEEAAARAEKYASHIIFVSNSTRRDFLKYHTFDKSRTHVVPIACNTDMFTNASLSKSYSNKPYFLYVGRFEHRKNLLGIIEAFDIFRSESDKAYQLKLVGIPGFGYEKIQQRINKSPYKEDIIQKGYIKNNELPSLYANASVFIFPSLYEGFGIPVLEAFAASVPVITSNTSSLPEVAGDAAVLVNPKESEEIAKAMKELVIDKSLRSSLINKGHERIKQFSWQKTAGQVLEVIKLTP